MDNLCLSTVKNHGEEDPCCFLLVHSSYILSKGFSPLAALFVMPFKLAKVDAKRERLDFKFTVKDQIVVFLLFLIENETKK